MNGDLMLFESEAPFLVVLKSKDPEYNLAAEEYLFSQRRENFILIWRNSPCVIIGKNQCAEDEVSENYRNCIPVLKRITGGGAVYHDGNNLNFSFIKNDSDIPSLSKYTKPIRDFLKTLGVETDLSDKNDILFQGKKISGTASCVRNSRVLFHGTLLFKCDAEEMERILTPSKEKLLSNGVRSVKSRVGEICSHINVNSVSDFQNLLKNYLIISQKAQIMNINDIFL